ncbi:MAG TPA: gliding motility-associated C-terminal domain-containing protein, partial [Saprospiraceae bacterium]|nr:gliding motility-associated C-terminal domain-containing protein [Saprospiraceae bacterium]
SIVDGYEPLTVIVQDKNNCTITKTVVGPLGRDCNEARLVITPNGDGINDYLILACANVFTLNKFTVFDRWGKVLLTRSGYTNDWDGVDKQGNPLPEGGYFWALEYINQNGNLEVAKGSITIVR